MFSLLVVSQELRFNTLLLCQVRRRVLQFQHSCTRPLYMQLNLPPDQPLQHTAIPSYDTVGENVRVFALTLEHHRLGYGGFVLFIQTQHVCRMSPVNGMPPEHYTITFNFSIWRFFSFNFSYFCSHYPTWTKIEKKTVRPTNAVIPLEKGKTNRRWKQMQTMQRSPSSRH